MTFRIRPSIMACLVVAAAATACESRTGDTPRTDASLRGTPGEDRMAASGAMSEASFAEAIRTLASDEFEGRGPSSPGEEKTVSYLARRFEEMGLRPGNGDSWFQEVPLVAITVEGAPALTLDGSTGSNSLAFVRDHVVWTKRVTERAALEASQLVFVGYGIVAPEYGWNDYQGVDMRGKTAVILVNDPGFATQDPALFQGNSMTYYGRWTYKYEEAARQGAAGALIVHETGAAGYPWEVVTGSWTGPQFGLVADDDNMSRVQVEGWITNGAARELFAQSGQDFDALTGAAARSGFRPTPLGVTASIAIRNGIRRSTSRNVLGVLPGGSRSDEYLVYMAHWDHFGRGPDSLPDPVYNGAFDNATGTAGLLEVARAFASLPERPARSILFLAVTAEEQGLLGSAYYATHPVVPTNRTVAAINMDGLNIDGPMRDITVVGLGNSDLDDYLAEAAAEVGRTIRPDPEPEKGFFYRSDHFSFAKVGIPSLYTDSGIESVEHGEAWTLARRADYTQNRYHKPSDEYSDDWDLTGALEDLELLFTVGHAIADSDVFPNWKPGNEFRAIRDADMDGSKSGS